MSRSVIRRSALVAASVALPLTLVAPPAQATPVPQVAPVTETVRAAIASAAPTTANTTGKPHDPKGKKPTPDAQATTRQAALEAVIAAGAVGAVAGVDVGRASWLGAAGRADLTTARAARPSDTVRVASNTKAMVATLVMQEVQRGRWTLRTTVNSVVPGLLPGHDEVTIEQLLSHRSGIPEFIGPLLSSATSIDDFVAAISQRRSPRSLVELGTSQPWSFTPGSQFAYSNTGYVVLGILLEKVNHAPLGRLLERRIFRPARMSTATYQLGRIAGRHLTEYANPAPLLDLSSFSGSTFAAAGAVTASMTDLDRFYDALLTGRLLAPRLVDDMLTPRTSTPLAYGLGVYAVPDPCTPGATLVGHDGASFGTASITLHSRDAKRSINAAFTGRDLSDLRAPTALAFGQAVLSLITTTCPAAATSAVRSGARSAQGWRLPQLDAATIARP